MILRHFADTLVFATNSETTCNEVRSVETPVKEPDEWNQIQNKTNQNLSNEVLSYYRTRSYSSNNSSFLFYLEVISYH